MARLNSTVYQILIASFAAIGSFLFGYDLGVIAEVVASDNFIALFLQENLSTRSGTVVSLFTAGAFFGAFFAAFGDRIGRRATICAATCVFIVGGIVQTSSKTLAAMYAGRFVAGLGVGTNVMIIPVFQAELSHHKIRGTVTSLQQLFSSLGQVTAGWTAYGCYTTWTGTGDSREWRVPLAIQIIPALFLASLIFVFPESPRWLCDHDQHEKALENLARLHAHGDKTDSYVVAEFKMIQDQVQEEHLLRKSAYKQLFTSIPNIRRVIIVTMIQAGCQMTGVSAIQYFSPQIFQQIGISTGRTLLFTAVNGIIGFIGTSLEMCIVDRIGRRPLEIWGSIVMAITFIVGAVLIAKYPAGVANTGAHWGFIITTWVYNFVFFISSGPLSWAIPPEIFTTATRDKGTSIGAQTSFAFNTMIGQITPIAVNAIGWRFYLVFVVCNLTNALFFWAFLPETKGLALEEMEELFRESPIFVPGSHWHSRHELLRTKEMTDVEKVEAKRDVEHRS